MNTTQTTSSPRQSRDMGIFFPRLKEEKPASRRGESNHKIHASTHANRDNRELLAPYSKQEGF